MSEPVVAYMALVFRRSDVEITPGMYEWPSGGSYLDPCPTNEMWTRIPLPGPDPLYMSMRIFTSNGLPPQQDLWSPPVLLVKHGDKGDTGGSGANGSPAPIVPGPKGDPGINGANAVSPVSMHWVGSLPYPPSNPSSGAAYYNTSEKKSFIWYDGAWYVMSVDGLDGSTQEGISIVWKGSLATPPENPSVNWVYRDTDNGSVYICTDPGPPPIWELMVLDGNSGYNTAVLMAYKRSAEEPTDNPGNVTYNFTLSTWTADPATPTMNGWSQSIPATDGNPLWVVSGTASAQEASDTVEATDWTSPVQLMTDGTSGPQVATVYLYQRTDADIAPNVPSVSVTYDFTDFSVTGLIPAEGWSATIPAATETSMFLWVTVATASSLTDTDTITTGEWQAAQKMATNGAPGQDGQDGGDGVSGRTVSLTSTYQVFTYDIGNANPSPANATVTATAANTVGTPYYNFIVDGESLQHTTSNTFVYTPSANYANMPDSVRVELREDSTTNPVMARDQMAMVRIKPGTNAITVEITNSAHTLSRAGAIVDYANSGTDIRVWEGVTPLTYATSGVKTFNIGTPTQLNIVAGSRTTQTKDVANDTARYGNSASLTVNAKTASITFPITARRADGTTVSLSVVQTISVSDDGADGDPATYVTITGPQTFKFLGGKTVPVTSPITLTATLFGGLTLYKWQYHNGSTWADLSGTINTSTYSMAYNNAAWGTNKSLRVRCLSGSEWTEVSLTKIYDGAAVFIVYHDNGVNDQPAKPATAAGTDNGWHTVPSPICVWMSQKVGDVADNTWGESIRIRGADGATLLVTPEAHSVTAAADGTDYSLTGVTGVSAFYQGTTLVTVGVVFSGTTTKNGLTFTVAADGSYSCSGAAWTTNSETFDLTATYNGNIFVRQVVIKKIRLGVTVETPTVPTGLDVIGAYALIILYWDFPTYGGHKQTEIWASIDDVIGNAAKVGETTANTFVHQPPYLASGQTHFYWIRHVNANNIAGDYNQSAGTPGSTAADPAFLLQALGGKLGYGQFDLTSGRFPIRTVTELPTLPDSINWPATSKVYLTSNKTLYSTDGAIWTVEPDQAAIRAEFGVGVLTAGSILAENVGTNEIIANAANIGNSVITSAKIQSVTADKITSGTVTADTYIMGASLRNNANPALATINLDIANQFFKIVGLDGRYSILDGGDLAFYHPSGVLYKYVKRVASGSGYDGEYQSFSPLFHAAPTIIMQPRYIEFSPTGNNYVSEAWAEGVTSSGFTIRNKLKTAGSVSEVFVGASMPSDVVATTGGDSVFTVSIKLSGQCEYQVSKVYNVGWVSFRIEYRNPGGVWSTFSSGYRIEGTDIAVNIITTYGTAYAWEVRVTYVGRELSGTSFKITPSYRYILYTQSVWTPSAAPADWVAIEAQAVVP